MTCFIISSGKDAEDETAKSSERVRQEERVQSQWVSVEGSLENLTAIYTNIRLSASSVHTLHSSIHLRRCLYTYMHT